MSIPTMIAKADDAGHLLNQIVESFEESWSPDCGGRIDELLPDRNHLAYNRIAVELMRIDMELSWRAGAPRRLQEYQSRYANVLSDSECLRQLAYEEYRQRLLNGETVQPKEYRQLNVDTDGWPDEPLDALDSNDLEAADPEDNFGGLDCFSHEANRLADAIAEMPSPGDTFAGLRIESQIGQGAFARVYLARQDELAKRHVVMKVSSSRTLEHEWLARLQHTNIVPIHSVHHENCLTAICMPLLGLNTLGDVLNVIRRDEHLPKTGMAFANALQSRPCPAPENGRVRSSSDSEVVTGTLGGVSSHFHANIRYTDACLQIAKDVAEGLRHAYDRGILHRDLKPANVLLADDGTARLLDFNVSDDILPGGPTSLAVGGTLPYMSPEQLRGVKSRSAAEAIDHRSDLYSFGVLLFELLTTRHPFNAHSIGAASTLVPQNGSTASFSNRSIGETIDDVLAERETTMPDVRAINQEVPPGIAAIVNKCLQPNADDRYQSVHELCGDLERHQQNQPLRHTPNALGERFTKWCRRHPRLSSGATVATITGLLLVAAIAWAMNRNTQLQVANARQLYSDLDQGVDNALALLSVPHLESAEVAAGREIADQLIARCNLGTLNRNGSSPNGLRLASGSGSGFTMADRLPAAESSNLKQSVAELHFLKANSLLWASDLNLETLNQAEEWNAFARRLILPNVHRAFELQYEEIIAKRAGNATASSERKLASQIQIKNENERLFVTVQEIQSGNWENAIAVFKQACEHEPRRFTNHFLLAQAYVHAKRPEDAERSFTTCAQLWPESYYAYLNRGQARDELQRHAEAIEDFTRVIQLEPEKYTGYANRAIAKRRIRQFESAEADMDEAIKRCGNIPRLYFLRAKIRNSLRKTEEAQKDLSQGFALDPIDEKDWLARGYAILDDDGNTNKALECFQEAIDRFPHSPEPVLAVAWLQSEKLNRDQDALPLLNDLVEQSPQNPEYLGARAVLHARQGDHELAKADIKRALEFGRDYNSLRRAASVYSLAAESNAQKLHASTFVAEALLLKPLDWSQFKRDKDLAPIRDFRAFRDAVNAAALLTKLKRTGQTNPEGHRRFDIQTSPSSE